MPKPINKTIGKCPCRIQGCDALADVRRLKNHSNGLRYLVCPVHGIDRAQGPQQTGLDEWIDAHGPAPETPAPESLGPKTPAPETPAPETPAPETPAPAPIKAKPLPPILYDDPFGLDAWWRS